MSKVNPKEAPKGYRAVATTDMCEGCHFDESGECPQEGGINLCIHIFREDGCDVVFKKIGRGKDLRGMEVGK